MTFSEIQREEGVYRIAGESFDGGGRVVVLRCGSEVTTFYYSPCGAIEPCLGVKDEKFVKVNGAVVCMEIKE